MGKKAIKEYLAEINKVYGRGDATEHSYRPAMKTLIEALGQQVIVTNEPQRMTDVGAPDMRVLRRIHNVEIPFGYIECKDIGRNLQKEEKSEQIQRYLKSIDCLILTDYLSFRLYIGGNLDQTAELAKEGEGGMFETSEERINDVQNLFARFFAAEPLRVDSAEGLAKKMAGIAQNLRYVIGKTFEKEAEEGTLHGQYKAFQKVLLHNLRPEEFADMYAQTICYGLFTARYYYKNGSEPFTRLAAPQWLPKTNPFLRETFAYIAGYYLDERIAWIVDGLAVLLDYVQMDKIRCEFGRKAGKEDPVVHFYETFLAAYDPKLRERRGVYYTPEPVVSYIVRSADWLLKKKFGLRQGLRDSRKVEAREVHECLILDPAVGTGTFLYEVIRLIYEGFQDEGAWSAYVKEHLLPRLFGFELMMAPYAVCHMKLGLELAETGYDFTSDERLGVYLTNTLEEAEEISEKLPFAQWISEEAKAANRVKQDLQIMVVLGNPPYSGHSANASWRIKNGKRVRTFIGNLIKDYYFVDGEPLGEKNPKWLQDDYVKFIRYGQYRIERTGCGILAFITNHGYLDNPTFRGMRQQLMKTFSEIYILDLHGNAKKKEVCPDGSRDENVFDIQQGVSIGIFVKERDKENKEEDAKVFHAELWGEKNKKYAWLNEHEIAKTDWKDVKPDKPFYLFCPQDKDLQEKYNTFRKITDVMKTSSVGIATARDGLTIGFSQEEIWDRVNDFVSLTEEQARDKYNLGKDTRDWKVSLAQEDLRKTGIAKNKVVPILYRPFDLRYTYYTGHSRGFICMPRPDIFEQMINGRNIALAVGRASQVIDQGEWNIVHCSRFMSELNLFRRGGNSLFPLYIYPKNEREKGKQSTFGKANSYWEPGKEGRIPNLDKGFVEELSGKIELKFVSDGRGDLKGTFGPEDVFDYIYGVFHSPAYRERYAEFLKIDFPRVPWPKDRQQFIDVGWVGGRLVKLHLMESAELEDESRQPRFLGEGEMEVARGYPQYAGGRVYINPKQYFEGVSEDVWRFMIGGYQVCEKWLKDRRGRRLRFDDVLHYKKICAALAETIRLMADERLKIFE
jgi:predicted helicase